MGFSLLLLLPLLADMLRMSDVAIVTVGVAFKLVRSVWAGFCTETWMVFLSVVAGSLGGLITPALRSVLSKIVKEGEVICSSPTCSLSVCLLSSYVIFNLSMLSLFTFTWWSILICLFSIRSASYIHPQSIRPHFVHF